MFRAIREFLFGKKTEATNTIWAPPPSPPSPTATVNPLTLAENENSTNSRLAENAKQYVGKGKVAAMSEPISAAIVEPVTAADEPAKLPRKRKPRTTKPKV